MNIQKIKAEDLRSMEDKEGLVLQGCGGKPEEWVDGINQMLTEDGILLEGSKFEEVSVFEHDGLACILYPFGEAKLHMGKLAVWRLQTHEAFGGTWLSDYVPNRLGGFRNKSVEKPDCALIGEDGNIFNLMKIASRTLRENGLDDKAEEMMKRITGGECHDYYEALSVIDQYVTITGKEEPEMGGMVME